MKSKYLSPFKPKLIKDYRPKNIKIYTFNAGFKKRDKDLLFLVFEEKMSFASVYSKTSMPAAPILWNKKNKNKYCKVLIVNSGNANAHTGPLGLINIEKYVFAASRKFQCKKSEILVSSTGVIGEQIDPKKIIKKLNLINSKSKGGLLEAAKSIMTTDTFPKVNVINLKYKSLNFKIYGFAKGSGMIAPNMGTMLAYIVIDFNLDYKKLQMLLNKYLESTFNSISVDGDTSTNDTVILFSHSKNISKYRINKVLLNKIADGLKKVMLNLSKQIITDGEGISRLIEVNLINAKSKIQAKKVAFSIAESLLVKSAIAGGDANWGRIVMAIGKADKYIDQNKISIKFDNILVSKNGSMYSKINIKKLNNYMKRKIIKINVDLSAGKHDRTVWSSDLTHNYLNINSDYRS